MNHKVSKLLRRFCKKANLRYRRFKRKYNTFNRIKRTLLLKQLKEENGRNKTQSNS